jgi:hypothetical protein
MSGRDKKLIAAGSLVLALAAGLGVRHHRAQQAIRLRAAAGPPRGLEANAVDPGLVSPPETPEAVAAEVGTSREAWRQAILTKNADSVLALDRTFMSSPDRYRGALVESAKKDADERVRAFSTRVLGKQKSPALAGLFEALLADKSPFVRQNAAWALGELAALEDGRAAARHAAAELRRARSKDPAPDVRTAAKDALARLE